MNKEKGSILLLTVIAIAFVSILGTALLSMSAMNVGMKYTDRTVKHNYYAAESGIEEAYAIVGQKVEYALLKAEEAMTTRLTDVQTQVTSIITQINEVPRLSTGGIDSVQLSTINVKEAYPLRDPDTTNSSYTVYEFYTEYLTPSLGVKTDKVQETVKEAYQGTFTSEWEAVIGGTGYPKKLKEILEDPTQYTFTPAGAVVKVTGSGIQVVGNQYTIPLKSTFTVDGVERVVEATIEVHKPDGNYPIQVQEQKYIDNPLWNYSIVCGGTVRTINGGTTTIKGNVYSKGSSAYTGTISDSDNIGLVSDAGSQVSIAGDIVTEGDVLKTGANGLLKVTSSNLYCRSLIADKNSTDATIQITDSYVFTKDDLEVNGTKSTVSIDGKYIGFADGSLADETSHDKSSAIIINSPDFGSVGSTLTITKATPTIPVGGFIAKSDQVDAFGIIVPGTAYMGVPNIYQTGESVSIKGNYTAYGTFFDDGSSIYDKDNIWTDTVLGMEFVKGWETEAGVEQKYTIKEKAKYFETFYQKAYKSDPTKYPSFNPGNGGVNIDKDAYGYSLGAYMTSPETGTNDTVHEWVSGINDADMKEIIVDVFSNFEYLKHHLSYRATDSMTPCASGCDTPIEHYLHAGASSSSYTTSDTILFVHDDSTQKVTIKNNKIKVDGRTVNLPGDKGIIIVAGDLDIVGDFTFNGTLVVEGNLTFKNGTHTLTNNEAVQFSLKEVVNQKEHASYQALFKNSDSYQTTTAIQPGADGSNAYRYSDIVHLTHWQ